MPDSDNVVKLDTVAAEVHATKVDTTAIINELNDIVKELRDVTEFIATLQAVVEQMSSNPMLKAMGVGGMPKLPGMVSLPGMPR